MHSHRQLSKFGGGGGGGGGGRGGLIDQGGGFVLGERCKLTQWGLGRSPSRFNFSVFVAISADKNGETFMDIS